MKGQGMQRIQNKYRLHVHPKTCNQFIEMMRDIYKMDNEDDVFEKILNDFRDGKLGKYTLDDISDYSF